MKKRRKKTQDCSQTKKTAEEGLKDKQTMTGESEPLFVKKGKQRYVLGHKKIDSLRHIRLTRNFNHPYFALSTFRERICQVTILCEMNLKETHKKYIKISHFPLCVGNHEQGSVKENGLKISNHFL